jgi:hypothetical protein
LPCGFNISERRLYSKGKVMRIGITALALTAAVAVSFSGAATPASAASSGITAKTAQHAATGDELSAAKRRHARVYRHYGYRSGNAAAGQAFGAIAGTIGGIVAAEQARRYYDRPYGYGYGYAPYGGYYGPYRGYGYYGY